MSTSGAFSPFNCLTRSPCSLTAACSGTNTLLFSESPIISCKFRRAFFEKLNYNRIRLRKLFSNSVDINTPSHLPRSFLTRSTCNQAILGGRHQHYQLSTASAQSSRNKQLVLGIETSCDDTGVAIVDEDGNVLGEALHSQTATHVKFGGILPPVARDLHKQHIESVVNKALQRANLTIHDVDAIAATVKPGLAMSLTVGLQFAQKLVNETGKPFIPIHHMEAHALTARMMHNIEFPFLVLLVSGGHCLLVVARDVENFVLLGQSHDDSPGDAFDKVARRMKLKNLAEFEGLCGGESVELMARQGNPKAFDLVTVFTHTPNCNFSFAGLKSSFRTLTVREEEKFGTQGGSVVPNAADICASFQYSILHHLAKRVQRGLLYGHMTELLPEGRKTLVVSGGVASNMFLREGLARMCSASDCDLVCPPPQLCTDNGIMIAWNGMEKWKRGIGVAEDPMAVDIQTRCPLGRDVSGEVGKHHIKLARVNLLKS